MKYRNRTRGFTIIELLSVLAIIAILSSVLLWFSKGSYQHSRDTLVKEYVQTLNKYVELYYLHVVEHSPEMQLVWETKKEALETMTQRVPNTNIVILKSLPDKREILDLIKWNKEKLQFEVRTKIEK